MTGTAGAALLRAEGLTKRFGGIQAVAPFTLTLGERGVYGIIGPNGAGKSTYFNLITRVVAPSEGRLWFQGREITQAPTHRRILLGMARTFQTPRVFPQLSVLENVMAGFHPHLRLHFLLPLLRPARVAKMDADARTEARRLLAELGLQGKEDELAGKLPHGLQRRVEIARCLAGRPQLLLMDEPAGGLTPVEKDHLSALVKELGRRMTVLLVEHDMRLVMSVCDWITVMHLGQKISEGTPQAVRNDPAVIEAYLGRRQHA